MTERQERRERAAAILMPHFLAEMDPIATGVGVRSAAMRAVSAADALLEVLDRTQKDLVPVPVDSTATTK